MTRLRRLSARVALALPAAAGLLLGGLAINNGDHAEAQDRPATDQGLVFLVEDGGTTYRVDISFSFPDTASDEEIAASVDAEIARLEAAGATRVTGAGESQAFVLDGASWPERSAAYYYNPAGHPPIPPDGLPELNAAAMTWNAAGSNFRFSTGGYTDAPTSGCGIIRDGQNTIGWVEKAGVTLAVTCRWSDPADGRFVEFDMEFDPGWDWTISQVRPDTDFQSVALHEFGHALGLNHISRSECDGRRVMCASYPPGAIIHDLSDDDVSGLYALYGVAPIPPSPTRIPPPAERGQYELVVPQAARK